MHDVTASLAPRSPSSFAIFRGGIEFCTQNLIPLLKVTWPLLVGLQVLELISDQYFDYVSEVIQRRGSENLLLLSGSAFLEFLTGLFFMAAWFLAVVPALELLMQNRGHLEKQDVPRLGRSFQLHLNQMLVEQTRVFAAILWRLPFFLILSPLEYIRLILVPYVVVLTPEYQAGRADALSDSRQLARGRWTLLIILALLTSLIPVLIKQLTVGGGNVWIWESPLRMMVNSVLQFFANVLSSMILFAVFKSLVFARKLDVEAGRKSRS